MKSIKSMFKSLKDRYRRFAYWQENGRPIKNMKMEETTCKHCGTVFKGNYCPRCGQSRAVSLITKSGFINAFMEAYPQLAASFLYTLLELILRPGYMIRDYFRGHRIIYSGPFKTFIVLGTIFVIVTKIGGIDKTEDIQREARMETQMDTELENYHKNHCSSKKHTHTETQFSKLEKLNKELDVRKGIGPVWQFAKNKLDDENTIDFVFLIPIFAWASKLAFRKREFDGRRLNYTEHFMVFIYIEVIDLLLGMAAYIFHVCAREPLTTTYPVLLLPFYITWIFKGLYGIGWWATVKRMLVFFGWCLLFGCIEFLLVIIGIAIFVYNL